MWVNIPREFIEGLTFISDEKRVDGKEDDKIIGVYCFY